jgi:hypothetical protein
MPVRRASTRRLTGGFASRAGGCCNRLYGFGDYVLLWSSSGISISSVVPLAGGAGDLERAAERFDSIAEPD